MKKYAVYGKGGIGKSTITSSLSAAIAGMGYTVMQIGCDPKADSTANLLNGKKQTSVMSYLNQYDEAPTLEDIVVQGYNGVYCVEAGGPTPGIGCAGRGIIATFNLLEELRAFGICHPDFVFFDVLGDVVCGGFSAPIRDGFADEVLIVTSGEKMSLFAARNIYMAVENFRDRGYASVRGVIINRKNIENEETYVQKFADEAGIEIVGDVPRDPAVQFYENRNQTVIQGDMDLPVSREILKIAEKLIREKDHD